MCVYVFCIDHGWLVLRGARFLYMRICKGFILDFLLGLGGRGGGGFCRVKKAI